MQLIGQTIEVTYGLSNNGKPYTGTYKREVIIIELGSVKRDCILYAKTNKEVEDFMIRLDDPNLSIRYGILVYGVINYFWEHDFLSNKS